jgi:hypothetical protein
LGAICMSSTGSGAASEVLFTFIDSSAKHANLLTDCSRGALFTCCVVQNPPLMTLPRLGDLVGLSPPFHLMSCSGRCDEGDLIVRTGNRFVGELSSIELHQHPLGPELGNWVQVAAAVA